MNTDLLHCPHCNLPLAELRPVDGRLLCPRCNELIPKRLWEGRELSAPLPSVVPISDPRSGVRRTLAVVLATMATMAAVAAVFVVMTQARRRGNDFREPDAPITERSVVALAPTELSSLGYLTRDTPLIVGIHAAQLRQSIVGKKLAESLGLNELASGVPSVNLPLDAEQIESIVLGLDPGKLPPRLNWIVHSRSGISPKRVGDVLKVQRSETKVGKTLNRFSYPFGKSSLELAYWLPDERTVAFGLPDDFERLPTTAHVGIDHLHPENIKLLNALPREAQAWAVGHFTEGAAVGKLLASQALPDAKWLPGLRTLAASVTPNGERIALRATLAFDTPARAELLRKQLEPLPLPAESTVTADGARVDVRATMTVDEWVAWRAGLLEKK